MKSLSLSCYRIPFCSNSFSPFFSLSSVSSFSYTLSLPPCFLYFLLSLPSLSFHSIPYHIILYHTIHLPFPFSFSLSYPLLFLTLFLSFPLPSRLSHPLPPLSPSLFVFFPFHFHFDFLYFLIASIFSISLSFPFSFSLPLPFSFCYPILSHLSSLFPFPLSFHSDYSLSSHLSFPPIFLSPSPLKMHLYLLPPPPTYTLFPCASCHLQGERLSSLHTLSSASKHTQGASRVWERERK